MKTSGMWAMIANRMQRGKLYSQPDYWDAKASQQAASAVSMWANQHLNALYHDEQVTVIASHLPDLAGKKILDIGCGTGRLSRYLADRGAQVYAIDFSPETVKIARAISLGDNPSYRVLSVFDLAEEAEYDIVLSLGVLTVACRDTLELATALRILNRALRPRGKLILVEPVHSGFLHRVLNLDLDGLLRSLDECGFAADHIEHLHFWPTRLVLAFFKWPKAMTQFGYHAGQAIMSCLPSSKKLSDYKAIFATRQE